MFLNRALSTANALINGRKGISPSANRFLDERGSEPITQITISRSPISSALIGTINVLSPNFKKKNKETLYHLKLLIRTSKTSLSLEKNSGIEISNFKMERNAENLYVVFQSGITLNLLLDRTKQLMGNRFLPYSSRDNNCQHFIIAILKANRLATSHNILFVEQAVEHLFTDNFRKVSNTVTGLAGVASILKEGGEIKYHCGEIDLETSKK
jgi:hypothetical protein